MFLKAVINFFAPKKGSRRKRNDDDPLAYHAYSDPSEEDVEEDNVQMPRIKEKTVFQTQEEANKHFLTRYMEYMAHCKPEADFYCNMVFFYRKNNEKVWLMPTSHILHEFITGVNRMRRKTNSEQPQLEPEEIFSVENTRMVIYSDEIIDLAVSSTMDMAREYGYLGQEERHEQ